ncbi:MAG: 2-amino-4-hydroxy-6-hydroxymethyldihydropteridine diphosphokinase [Bacteroidota bacterium]
MAGPSDVYIGLGANLGDRLAALQQAVKGMSSWPETEVVGASSIYETEAHVLPGQDRQPDHLNAVVQLRTALCPHDVLERLQSIERTAGRDPEAAPWSPRPLDLDILIVGAEIVDDDELAIPHPRIAERRFVLAPLAEIAPEIQVGGMTVAALLAETSDTARITRTGLTLLEDQRLGE